VDPNGSRSTQKHKSEKLDPDPDPHQLGDEKPDPDTHQSDKQDPDPHPQQFDADQRHWYPNLNCLIGGKKEKFDVCIFLTAPNRPTKLRQLIDQKK
jgi:hypothetical protein